MSAFERIQWLHKYIMEEKYPNANRLAERFSISHRQAQRDVEALRSEYGAPIAYSAAHRGFYYTKAYSLPSYTVSANEYDYFGAMMNGTRFEEREALQMQIPYSAVVRIPDKLTQMELNRLIVGKRGKDEYVCEFHSTDLFLGLILTADTDITVLEPEWLRRQLVACASRVLKNHKKQ